ncbi:Leucine-rich repeat flightless-interacting protein 2 [Stylophora pistillata]|uniref:Leucine-rich repeat flightless-interacting protein 2 n=1 Tax=Stylophora pistillata TaxID=50429 RepID=A0A2B4S7N5_STYPI|nr:Leucine-rich repeat flightless-interacting protein 2 [Stylophora pistillata]
MKVAKSVSNGRFLNRFLENLKETEDKYRKAMVSIAQLDNEKQALLYQVDCLKDRLVEEEEISGEVRAECKEKTKECSRFEKTIKSSEEEIQRLKEAIEFRDNFLAERGLSLYEDQYLKDGEDEETSTVTLRDALSLAVPDETSSDRSSVSEPPKSRSNSRRPSLSDEKDVLVLQIKNLQTEVASLKREDIETPKAITADLEELRREFSRQINDFKIKLQKAEQDNARLEGLVARLESQVKRYKSQAEAAPNPNIPHRCSLSLYEVPDEVVFFGAVDLHQFPFETAAERLSLEPGLGVRVINQVTVIIEQNPSCWTD